MISTLISLLEYVDQEIMKTRQRKRFYISSLKNQAILRLPLQDVQRIELLLKIQEIIHDDQFMHNLGERGRKSSRMNKPNRLFSESIDRTTADHRCTLQQTATNPNEIRMLM